MWICLKALTGLDRESAHPLQLHATISIVFPMSISHKIKQISMQNVESVRFSQKVNISVDWPSAWGLLSTYFLAWDSCLPRPKLSVASVYWTYTDSVHWVHWWHTGHTLTQYTGPLVSGRTLMAHWHTVYSHTGATLDPLQCMHSVHWQCTSSVYTGYTELGSG